MAQKALSGWGRVPVETCAALRPELPRELHAVLDAADGHTLVARGLGRSYGDAALNPDGVVLTERCNRLLAWDEATGLLTCEAGVSLRDLLRVFVPKGFFLPVMPGTQFVTVGGAIACDVHGKNHHVSGGFSNFVAELTLLDGEGRLRTCSREVHPELFWATIGGMGLTGVITAAVIQLRRISSAYVRMQTRRLPDLDATLADMAETQDEATYAAAWIDGLAKGAALGRSVVMRGEHAGHDELKGLARKHPLLPPERSSPAVPARFPGWALNRRTGALFNALYRSLKREGERLVDFERFFHPLDRLRHWNRLYGRRGFVQYQCVVPPEASAAVFTRILKSARRAGETPFLIVLKRMGPQGEGFLSFPLNGFTLAFDLPYRGESTRRLAAECDEWVAAAGGRVYLAKDALLNQEHFRAMYPRAQAFLAVKAAVDPKGRFASTLGRRLGLCPA